MKKRMNILMLIVWLVAMFAFISPVSAAGTVTASFVGNSSVAVGSNITLTLKVNNVTSGDNKLYSIGGFIEFDSEYLQFVDCVSTSSLILSKNTTTYKIALADYTMSNGVGSNTNVATVTFKALKNGNTTVNLKNAEATDKSSDLTVNFTSKNIKIGDTTPTPTPQPTTTPTSASTKPVNKSNDATLKKLSVSGYDLIPLFDANTTEYVVKVPTQASFINITGAANNSKATVSGLGNINLTGDSTTATVKVKAEDGTIKEYKIRIEKEEKDITAPTKSSDATLKVLDVSGYTLIPTFKNSVTSYSMNVQNTVTGLNVTAIANDPKAKVEISGNKSFKVGVNTITIKVTAENGTTRVYTVNVKRKGNGKENGNTEKGKSSDNSIESFLIKSPHTISPAYSDKVDNYNVTVPYNVDKLDIGIVLKDPKATYTITDNNNFKVEEVNVVTVKVVAEDGTTRLITLNVTRSLEKDATSLKDLNTPDGSLNPKFDPNTLDYDINIPKGKNTIDINAVPAVEGSKVEIFGNDNLKDGLNKIKVLVTDKNGYTKTYTINAYKEPETKIFGLSLWQFGILAAIIGTLLLLLLFLLFRRKKKDPVVQQSTPTPVIDFKPEFNFGSRNGTDDDVVYSGATLNQSSNNEQEYKEGREKSIDHEEAKELPYIDKDNSEEVPYDMYDEIVTKDELIDAIHEGLETKNPQKLQMLLEQEELNRKKEAMRKRDEER